MTVTRDELVVVIQQLLDHLPDSRKSDDRCWDWAWGDLQGEAQDAVKEARATGRNLIAALNAERGTRTPSGNCARCGEAFPSLSHDETCAPVSALDRETLAKETKP